MQPWHSQKSIVQDNPLNLQSKISQANRGVKKISVLFVIFMLILTLSEAKEYIDVPSLLDLGTTYDRKRVSVSGYLAENIISADLIFQYFGQAKI